MAFIGTFIREINGNVAANFMLIIFPAVKDVRDSLSGQFVRI